MTSENSACAACAAVSVLDIGPATAAGFVKHLLEVLATMANRVDAPAAVERPRRHQRQGRAGDQTRSGSEPKLADRVQRYILTVFAYGGNLRRTEAARHMQVLASAPILGFGLVTAQARRPARPQSS